jgi:2-polyprenyl-6-methoxyphenol hydroxylase-like FAD-dependent oxidoreductase
MMLGLLLARAAVDVIVLEKHADFLRDFRGDTIHPSTLELMHELGVLDEFLRLPHQAVPSVSLQIGDETFPIADLTRLPTRCKFVALMPQWDFLDFLAREARRWPTFHLRMNAEATGLVEDNARVAGVRATTPEGVLEVRADLVVGADGRSSNVRAQAGLPVRDLGAPMDVLWFRVARRPHDPEAIMGRLDAGRILVLINRGDYWQCGLVIVKGAVEELRRRGLDRLRTTVAEVAPFLRDRVNEIASWEAVKLLTVKVDRLEQWWRAGLLCIGDAAHAMSPIGGVGINLAIQDAVAAANILARPLHERRVDIDDLRRVERRRQFPTRVIQRMQLTMQRRVIARVLGTSRRLRPPLALRVISRVPALRRLIGRVIGLGVRPEHVHTPAVAPRT